MINHLNSLRKLTTIVADTSDINIIKSYHPQDATTNPSLILNAIELAEYNQLIHESIKWAYMQSSNKKKQIEFAYDKLIVSIGAEILKLIPGRISTEIDARLSYDINGSIKKARNLIKLYNEVNINNERVLIKIASTWQGIKAAEELEKEGIKCNLTLLFSFAQAQACAEAKVFMISPFVGRILDWYQNNNKKTIYEIYEDPGVTSVYKIYNFYKKYEYKTAIMAASFRNINQIIALAGCDYLTISHEMLKQLNEIPGAIKRKLYYNGLKEIQYQKRMTESEFLYLHNQDQMAVIKLSEGINNFIADQNKINKILSSLL